MKKKILVLTQFLFLIFNACTGWALCPWDELVLFWCGPVAAPEQDSRVSTVVPPATSAFHKLSCPHIPFCPSGPFAPSSARCHRNSWFINALQDWTNCGVAVRQMGFDDFAAPVQGSSLPFLLLASQAAAPCSVCPYVAAWEIHVKWPADMC